LVPDTFITFIRLEAYEQLCREAGEAPAHIALLWLLHQPAVAAPIIGPRTINQLNGTMRAFELTLSKDFLQQLDTIFPGPGGQAPRCLRLVKLLPNIRC
jgi:NDP-hexose 2,3-enoyl reductase